ncbi:hypothetical protein PIB30_042975 [Stylosanthes scabra]|uniref:Uncharacterized protein n=1 Tax=Stylosanthes scabra TaxID=79078 RepID=A0ABU6RFF5_9FABA|nr:hypothetical protein [Stylosanthes scabra]
MAREVIATLPGASDDYDLLEGDSDIPGTVALCNLVQQHSRVLTICIIMNLYEGSVGDKMARLREGWVLLQDVLRYGINLAQGVLELHSKGTLFSTLNHLMFFSMTMIKQFWEMLSFPTSCLVPRL